LGLGALIITMWTTRPAPLGERRAGAVLVVDLQFDCPRAGEFVSAAKSQNRRTRVRLQTFRSAAGRDIVVLEQT